MAMIVTGTAEVAAPTRKARRDARELPQVQLIHHDQHDALLSKMRRSRAGADGRGVSVQREFAAWRRRSC